MEQPRCRWHGDEGLCDECGTCLKCQDNLTSQREGADLVYYCSGCDTEAWRVDDVDDKTLDTNILA